MYLMKNQQAVSAKYQLKEFEKRYRPAQCGEVLQFYGVDGFDVYNPSIPFQIDGKTVIAGRVENRSNEISKTMFFERDAKGWRLLENAPVLDLQDPFVSWIDGETWIGGVSVIWDGPRCVEYSTHYYKGTSLSNLQFAFSGPKMMKDVRLLQLPDGKIAVFSRPQGEPMQQKYGCVAKIGMTIADSAADLCAELIENAPLLEGQFIPEEWGGCNQLYNLKNGLIGVIGHKAWGEQVEDVFVIHYYSMSFAVDPQTRACTQTKIIATRDCYPQGPKKNARTADVTFTSGILRREDGTAVLYAGLNDCQAGRLVIEDPLIEYEQIVL